MDVNDLATIAGIVLAYAGPLVGIFVRMESRFSKLESAMGITNGNVTPLPTRLHRLELAVTRLRATCPYCGDDEEYDG